MSESDAPWTARVVVGVSGSLGSHTALCRAAGEARRRGAELWPFLAWEPPGGELAARRTAAAFPHAVDWRRLGPGEAAHRTRRRVRRRWSGVVPHALVARGAPGRVLVEIADRKDDVLVVGAGRRGRLRRALRRSASRYWLAHAACPFLAVPPSPLETELVTVHRRDAWRLRLDTRDLGNAARTVPPDA